MHHVECRWSLLSLIVQICVSSSSIFSRSIPYSEEMLPRNITMFTKQYDCQQKLRLGETEGGWVACATESLNRNSIVYSFGLGKDPAFDLSVISKFGSAVHAFDPTPTGERTYRNERFKPRQWVFHPWGLHNEDGNITFFVPKGHGQYSIQNSVGKYSDNKISLPGYRLSTIMKKLGHSYVDICKIDVEGSEWGVIEDFIENRPNIKQLFFEFHYFDLDTSDFYSRKLTDFIQKLNAIGYRWFYRKTLRHFVKMKDPNGLYNFIEYSFIKA